MSARKQERLRNYVALISRSVGGLEALPARPLEAARGGALESAGPPADLGSQGGKSTSERIVDKAIEGTKKLAIGADLSPEEMFGVEAIIIPDKRPAFDVVDGNFAVNHALWRKLVDDTMIHDRLVKAIPRIGRIELLNQSRIPYGGTGFVVGDRLLMTNRHVAEIFARGLGDQEIRFKNSIRPGLDLRRERDRPSGTVLNVRNVRMIHPWWDMALLEVDGLPAGLGTLRLSTQDARDLSGREVAVVGYPAYDPARNDPDVQDLLFDRTYGVKRLQPGMIAPRRTTESFNKLVDAAAHDCSTLGGNSGSAVIDLDSGEVLALHFGGRYLDTNVAVPASELSRDGHVRDAGVLFSGSPPGGAAPAWLNAWNTVEVSTPNGASDSPIASSSRSASRANRSTALRRDAAVAGQFSIEIPLRITVELGGSQQAPSASVSESFDITEAMREPEHDTDYSSREGYSGHFLSGSVVPIPQPRRQNVLAPLKNGGTELKYENFSVLMHARRRLALVTASNITRAAKLRKPEPGRDYTRKGLSGLGDNDREKWFTDSRMETRYQLPDAFFTKDDGAFDKGHIVRREDVAWGKTYEILQRANGDTYHVTNCSPQVAQFNQSARGEDNWGDLENLVLAEAADERLCVFAGPVLDDADETFLGRGDRGETLRVKIPTRFWKVIVARTQSGIAAYGFVLEQDISDVPVEFVVPENFRRLQVPLTAIEDATGLNFGDDLGNSDMFNETSGVEAAWRGGLERATSLAREPSDESKQPTPNGGDDDAAEPGVNRRAPLPLTEAPIQWRTARALDALRSQVNARAPDRSRASDGSIGDAAHATRNSDHNPWVRDGDMGVVTAVDITHDPTGGCDAGVLANAIVSSRDGRVKYVIWNRQIANFRAIDGTAAWTWRPYNGSNPHNKHVHVSVRPEKTAYDDMTPWSV